MFDDLHDLLDEFETESRTESSKSEAERIIDRIEYISKLIDSLRENSGDIAELESILQELRTFAHDFEYWLSGIILRDSILT